MHAYLFVGEGDNLIDEEIKKLNNKLKTLILEFPIKGIDEVRKLGKFINLSLNKPTSILIKNIDQIKDEALNALLKNLEEPQKNLNFFLTASSVFRLLPTIISRCQIIKVKRDIPKEEVIINSSKFINLNTGQRLRLISEIRERKEALKFLQQFITGAHQLIHKKEGDKYLLARALELSQKALNNLNSNVNVGLVLTNFSINF